MKNIYDKVVCNELINRINNLHENKTPNWGKMSAPAMLAHCNVAYEMVYENKHPKPSFFNQLIAKLFIKNIVVSEKTYKPNSPTAPAFIIKGDKNFAAEKTRLINYINRVQQDGSSHFEGKASHSFGVLTASQWNNMFYKHLDHHLTQFGV